MKILLTYSCAHLTHADIKTAFKFKHLCACNVLKFSGTAFLGPPQSILLHPAAVLHNSVVDYHIFLRYRATLACARSSAII